jgi:Leucine-rich repeat (LRR) protein
MVGSEEEWRARFPEATAQETIDQLIEAVEETDECYYARIEEEDFPEPFDFLTTTRELRLIELEDFDFCDLSPLSALTQLRVLSLRVTQDAKLEALACLNLHELEVSGGEMASFEFLTSLADLKKLYLLGNSPHALPSLGPLEQLAEMWWQAKVRDLSALRDATSLQKLELHGNDIEDVSALSGLTRLKYLTLDGNRVSDKAPLKQLPELEHLDI